MRSRAVGFSALFAIIFGLLTIASGALALFGGAEMGAVVPFVLWFNFLAGFAYTAAGIGIWRRTAWRAVLSQGLAAATACVFVLFLWHVAQGGAYEARTVAAMVFRLMVWIGIAGLVTVDARRG